MLQEIFFSLRYLGILIENKTKKQINLENEIENTYILQFVCDHI